MEFLPEFEVLRHATIEDAVAARAVHPEAPLLAGGTDLIPNLRRGIGEPETVIELTGIDALYGITATGDGGVRIGAAVTLAEIADGPEPLTGYTALIEAASVVAGNTHRQVATLGGNLCLDTRCVYYNQSHWWRSANDFCLKYEGDTCHVAPSGTHCFAAFSGDVAPAVLVFGGQVEIAGPNGTRTVPLPEIYTDDGLDHLQLEPGEMLTAVILPPHGGAVSGYAKSRVRGSIDFPLAGVAIALTRDGDQLTRLDAALTGTNSCPIVVDGTADLLGHDFTEATADALAALLPKQIQPMTSTFTPPGYRRKVVAALAKGLVTRLFEEA